jgi:hypothetical protein
VGKGTLFVPAAHGRRPLLPPDPAGFELFGPSRADPFSMRHYRGFRPRLLMSLPCGEHGTVKPLRVAVVEPVAYPNESYSFS